LRRLLEAELVQNRQLSAGGSLRATDGTITVRARNEAKTETQAKAGNVSAAAGSLMVAETHAHGSTVVDVGNGGVFDAGKGKITLEAKNEEELSSKTVVGNAAFGAGDISVVKAMFGAAGKAVQTTLAIGSGNIFRAGAMDAVAQANLKSKVDLVGVNVGSIALGLNNADSGVYSDVSVTAGKNVYGSKERRMDSLRLRADNIASHSVTAQTAQEALAAGLGNNWVRAADVFHTTVTAAGMDKASRLKDAAIEAAARADVTASSTSFGGVSVGENIAAAELDQSLTSDTTTTISGEWEMEGDLKASATNHEKLKLKSDTSSAALLDAHHAGPRVPAAGDVPDESDPVPDDDPAPSQLTRLHGRDVSGPVLGEGGVRQADAVVPAVDADHRADDCVVMGGALLGARTRAAAGPHPYARVVSADIAPARHRGTPL